MEIWKTVENFEMYEISSYGRLRKNYKKGFSKILKPDTIRGGYLRYTLSKNGEAYHFIAHRMVAKHFIPNIHNYPDINHIDNNRTNNRVENLEWCTPKMNAQHREKQGRNPSCKKVYQYDKDLNLIAIYKSTRECARITGYAKSAVQVWCSNKKVIPKNPYKWSYLPLTKESSTTRV